MGCVALICLWRRPAPGVRCSQSRRRPAPYTMSQSWLDKALAPPRYMYTTYSLPQALCLISRERVSHDNYNTILNSIIHPCYERHFDESSASLKWGDVLQDMLGFLSDRRSSAVTGEAIPGGAGQFSRCCSLQSWGVPSKMGCVNLCSLRMGPPCRHPSMVRRHVSLGVRTLPQALQSPNNYRPHQQPLYQLAQSLPKKADETVHPSLSCTTNPHIIPASNFYLHGRLAMTIS